MATHKVSPLSSPAQFPVANNLDARRIAQESFAPTPGRSLYLALIQQSVPGRRPDQGWRDGFADRLGG